MNAAINRVEELYKNWEHLQNRLVESGLANDASLRKVKYDYLKQGLWRIAPDATHTEKIYLRLLSSLTAKLHREIHPKRGLILQAFFYLKSNLIDRPLYMKQIARDQEINVMLLKNDLAKSGFGALSGIMERSLDFERSVIELRTSSKLKDQRTLDVQLNIRKDANGVYRLAEYKASLSAEKEGFEPRTIVVKSQEFNVNQALSLLEGKAHLQTVLDKVPTSQQKWVQLDLTQRDDLGNFKLKEFHQNYEFDLKGILHDYAKRLGVPGLMQDSAYQNITRGADLSVRIPGQGQYVVQANPGENTLNFYKGDQLVNPEMLVPAQPSSKGNENAKAVNLSKQTVLQQEQAYGQSIAG